MAPPPAGSVRKIPPEEGTVAARRAAELPGPQRSEVREWVEAIVVAFFLAVILRTFLIQAYKIPSGSMEPTLLIGDHIMVNKVAYGLRMPDSLFGFTPLAGEIPYGRYLFRFGQVHRGDVVVFVFPVDPTKDFIKRVIGVGGDTIEVKSGVVWLNGKPMPDPHAHFEVPTRERSAYSPRDNYGPFTVPAGKFFMMGDNRDHSYDSRFWGTVSFDQIEGHALFIYWSWGDDSHSTFGIRWNRVGKAVR
ncbi:MAG TPA: signal peptidase I [Candidatus Binataceae bacterium]|jgi:signal peptidase I|nr:signal peptidase I [Candidatus Binataceae bacterium]